MELSTIKKTEYLEYKDLLFNHLNDLRTPEGLFYASSSQVYNASWFRDNLFINLAYLKNDRQKFIQTIHTHLDIFKKFEQKYSKFSSVIESFPKDYSEMYRFLHAKINPVALDEIEGLGGNWNHRQWDVLGLFLINLSTAMDNDIDIIRDKSDRDIIQLFIDYTCKVGFTVNASAWEEENEIRASSTGLILKGLLGIRKYEFNVPEWAISMAQDILSELLPYEHKNKNVDLVLLFLPFFGITDSMNTKYIVKNVEQHLMTYRGVKRYKEDEYFEKENGEKSPSWVFGFSYLSCIYNDLGHKEIAKMYIDKIKDRWTDGRIPEIELNSGKANINTPLAWGNSMAIISIDKFLEGLN